VKYSFEISAIGGGRKKHRERGVGASRSNKNKNLIMINRELSTKLSKSIKRTSRGGKLGQALVNKKLGLSPVEEDGQDPVGDRGEN